MEDIGKYMMEVSITLEVVLHSKLPFLNLFAMLCGAKIRPPAPLCIQGYILAILTFLLLLFLFLRLYFGSTQS